MTQSGQGEEPSARPAREGIVLPSDGGEPLVPGLTAPQGTPRGGTDGGSPPASAPPGGQTWGTPWGPDGQNPPPPAGQDWTTASGGQWGMPEQSSWSDPNASRAGQGPGPLPPEGAPPQQGGAPMPGYQSHPDAGAHAPYGGAGHGAPSGGQGGYGTPAPDAYGPPAGGHPDGSEGATQLLPPMPPGGADQAATQYIPPVGPGALPPEMPAAHDSQATQYLPPQPAPGAGNPDAEATQYIAPVADQPPGPSYEAPSPPPGDGNRQPPAEFDNLFRSNDSGSAGSTQQLPLVEYDAPAGAAPVPPPPPPRADTGRGRRAGGRDNGAGGRFRSRGAALAALGVGIAVVGVGAGAMLGSGSAGDKGSDNHRNVSATAPAGEGDSPSPSVDPAREQAVELDKLLAESGASRSAVIDAVADVKACRDLAAAAKDLRDAAGQRNQLVTDLSALSVDKLPEHQALTAALTKAWRASASADNHYAAWADEVARSKGKHCKKGQANSTGHTRSGNRASGTATKEKGKAAQLWNVIAKQHGLTERQPTQL